MNQAKQAAFKELFGREPRPDEIQSIDDKRAMEHELYTIGSTKDLIDVFIKMLKKTGHDGPDIAHICAHIISEQMIPDLTLDKESALRTIAGVANHAVNLFLEGRDSLGATQPKQDVIHLGFNEDEAEKINAPYSSTKQ